VNHTGLTLVFEAVAFAGNPHGRNAKLLFSAFLKVDAREAGLYLQPKHKRVRRKPRIVSSI
jgi:hypothetical protein